MKTVLMHLNLVAVLAAAMCATATGAVHQDPRVCGYATTEPKAACASEAAINQIKHAIHTDGIFTCTPKAANLLRYRCSWRNAVQSGLAVVSWTATFRPAVELVSLVCEDTDINGNPIPTTRCTKTVPYQEGIRA